MTNPAYLPYKSAAPHVGPRAPFQEAGDHTPAVPSPARALQIEIAFAWEEHAPARWPPAGSLAFILLSNGLFWFAAAWIVRGLA